MSTASVAVTALPDTATVVTVLTGTVLPWLTGRVTRITAHPRIKGALLLALSVLASVLSELGQVIVSGGSYDPWRVILGALGTYAVGVVLHTGLYRHLDAYQSNAAAGGLIGPRSIAAPKGTT